MDHNAFTCATERPGQRPRWGVGTGRSCPRESPSQRISVLGACTDAESYPRARYPLRQTTHPPGAWSARSLDAHHHSKQINVKREYLDHAAVFSPPRSIPHDHSMQTTHTQLRHTSTPQQRETQERTGQCTQCLSKEFLLRLHGPAILADIFLHRAGPSPPSEKCVHLPNPRTRTHTHGHTSSTSRGGTVKE